MNGPNEQSKYAYNICIFGNDLNVDCLQTLRLMSPTSLKVTLHQLNLGAKISLGECLQMEFRLTLNFLGDDEFHEGIITFVFLFAKKRFIGQSSSYSFSRHQSYAFGQE